MNHWPVSASKLLRGHAVAPAVALLAPFPIPLGRKALRGVYIRLLRALEKSTNLHLIYGAAVNSHQRLGEFEGALLEYTPSLTLAVTSRHEYTLNEIRKLCDHPKKPKKTFSVASADGIAKLVVTVFQAFSNPDVIKITLTESVSAANIMTLLLSLLPD
ncbi:hypothetical protein MMC20_002713 [Loxospora ochrophaea]|nr:hypothetical protein [Loxospora ochrophaea]